MQAIMKSLYTSDEVIREVAKEMGRKGGSSRSALKVAAGSRNAFKATAARRYKASARRLESCRIADYEKEKETFERLYREYIVAMRT